MDELDDFLESGYEQLHLELKERAVIREAVIRIADLISQITRYIIENDRSTMGSFSRMSSLCFHWR